MSSDEERRKLLKPAVPLSAIVDFVSKNFSSTLGLPGNVVEVTKELESYDDQNFLLTCRSNTSSSTTTNSQITTNKTQYLLKIHNGVESLSPPIIDFQNSIMAHLNETPGVTTTQPLPSDAGGLSVTASLPVLSEPDSPAPLTVRLLTYIEGTPMAYKTVTPSLLRTAGAYLANVDKSLDGYSHPASKRYHAWDARNTCDLRPFVKHINTEPRRRLVSSVIDAFESAVMPDDKEFRMGVLQSDFNDANIICGEKEDIRGVIDFGDSVYSWRVLDLSVALAYAMLTTYGKTCHSLSALCSFLRGYASSYPLTPVERRHLVTLVCCRLACSATLGAYSYSQDPSNEYLLLHAEPCWKALEMLWTMDRGVVEGFLDLALEGGPGVDDLAIPDPSVVDVLSSVRSRKRKRAGEGSDGTVTFVTGNQNKLAEVRRLLPSASVTSHKLDLPELQGDPLYVSREKCLLASKEISGPVITEDTSLCFNALGGMPGPYIKWFLESCGHSGLNKMLDGFADRTAYARTVVAYCDGVTDEVKLFDGQTRGTIVEARGPTDFGWDPVFQCEEGSGTKGKTYAEMGKEEKNEISHRGKAFKLLREWLESKNKI